MPPSENRLDVHVRHVPRRLLLPVGDAVAPRVPRQHDVSNLLCGNHGIPSVSHQLYFRLVLMQPALWSAELYLYTGVRAVDGGVRGNGRELRQVQRVAVLPERRSTAVPPKRLRGHGKQRERAEQLHLRWGVRDFHPAFGGATEGAIARTQCAEKGRTSTIPCILHIGPQSTPHDAAISSMAVVQSSYSGISQLYLAMPRSVSDWLAGVK